jgi:hypothetical protein
MATETPRSIGPVPDGVTEDLNRFLEQTRRLLLDYTENKADVLARIAQAATIVSAPGPIGVPGPPGPPAGDPTPDVTPPPTPTGVVITAGLNTIFVETDDPAPIVTQGHGYQRTVVYGSTLPSPTFGDAVLVHEFEGPWGSFSSNSVESCCSPVWRSQARTAARRTSGDSSFMAKARGPSTS